MKWSIYNECIENEEDNETFYLYNCFRGIFFTLDHRLHELISIARTHPERVRDVHPDLYKSLLDNRFIIEDEHDETEECVVAMEKRFCQDNRHLHVTINPTLDCNLRCWYCYEEHHRGSQMKKEIMDGVIKYLKNMLNSTADVKSLVLSFFGGEPLLKFNQVVMPLISESKGLCNEYGKDFHVHFTTNGVFISKKVLDDLSSTKSDVTFQIALDGSRDYHDGIKMLPNGRGSYDKIKTNIMNSLDRGMEVNVRCNYTTKNIHSFACVLDDFKDYWNNDRLRFSFHKVWQEPNTDEIETEIKKLKMKVRENGIRSNLATNFGEKVSNCYADYTDNLLFNHDGLVFRCTAREFTESNSIGRLDENGIVTYKDGVPMHFSERITGDCAKCRLLPICMVCLQRRKESKDGTCPDPSYIENAGQTIKRYFIDKIKH